MFRIQGRTDEEFFTKVIGDVIVPDFAPKERQQGENYDQLFATLPNPSSLAGFRLHPIEFDKDIDDHMLLVTVVAGLLCLEMYIVTGAARRPL